MYKDHRSPLKIIIIIVIENKNRIFQGVLDARGTHMPMQTKLLFKLEKPNLSEKFTMKNADKNCMSIVSKLPMGVAWPSAPIA